MGWRWKEQNRGIWVRNITKRNPPSRVYLLFGIVVLTIICCYDRNHNNQWKTYDKIQQGSVSEAAR